MAPLRHPAIQDGWFREVSSLSPGQAIALKVRKILHIEESLRHDILVFESETYGIVLVLDGAIQYTERDGFSFQEMMTHLPLASHPSPEEVLVIGGGEGGVVREVLKHQSVKSVVVCDVDEAAVRVRCRFFPHMSTSFDDPRVTVHVNNGFTLLREGMPTFDVIIINSRSTDIPLTQTQLELLHRSLAPGGRVAVKAPSQWAQLRSIKSMVQGARSQFPEVRYAYTAVPTNPYGQIGILVCAKEAGSDLQTPLRAVGTTTYYTAAVHRAAFTLPEFARAYLQDGTDLRPRLGKVLAPGEPVRKVLLLGSGLVARPAAEYIVRDPRNHLTVACRTLTSAQALCAGLPNTTAAALDVTDAPALTAAVAMHDLVVSLVPYAHHAAVIAAAIAGRTHVVTTSYVSPAMRALDTAARAAGIVVLNEAGLDPGIDHLYAVKTIDEVHARGGRVRAFVSCCGGLPAPACADNPLGLKFSWSPRGVLANCANATAFLEHGVRVAVPGDTLMDHAVPYVLSPAYALVAYPNRDAAPFRAFYGIPEAHTVKRCNLRYQGFPQMARTLVRIGWLDPQPKEWLSAEMSWAQVTQRLLDAPDSSEGTLVALIRDLCTSLDPTETARIVSGLRWMGLFSTERVSLRGRNLLDTLCARLEGMLAYERGERDLVLLQHRFDVEWADGTTDTLTSTLEAYGEPDGPSAMARLVGLPCGIAVQLVLDGVIATPGVIAPYTKEICDPLREQLEKEGVGLVEKVL